MKRMTNAELIEYNRNRKICQICICTKRDVEEVMDEWIYKLKVGPWKVISISDENVIDPRVGDEKLEGKFKYICALATYGNVQIEIMQPVFGYFPAQNYLDRRGEGLQHFKEQFSTDEEMQARVKELETIGYKKMFNGGLHEDRFCLFDTEDSLGFTLELGNFANITLDKSEYYIYPREN